MKVPILILIFALTANYLFSQVLPATVSEFSEISIYEKAGENVFGNLINDYKSRSKLRISLQGNSTIIESWSGESKDCFACLVKSADSCKKDSGMQYVVHCKKILHPLNIDLVFEFTKSRQLADYYIVLNKNKIRYFHNLDKYIEYEELAKLEKAFNMNSGDLLDEFFLEWFKEYRPNKRTDTLNQIYKDIYEIYCDFYDPIKLKRINKKKYELYSGENRYLKSGYIIIQDKVYYKIFNSDSLDYGMQLPGFDSVKSRTIEDDFLYNFRPDIHLKKLKPLFLTDKYLYILKKFTGMTSKDSTFIGINNEGVWKESFLENKIAFYRTHYPGGIYFETFPYINSIWFNKTNTVSFVNFQILYQGGCAIYVKKKNKWKFIDSYTTWIE